MSRLAITAGIPLSGKSTFSKVAKEYGWVVINPDTMRIALHGKPVDPLHEDFIWKCARVMAKSLLMQDYKVLIDATHYRSRYRLPWIELSKEVTGKDLLMFKLATNVERSLQLNEKEGRLDPAIIHHMNNSFDVITCNEGEYYRIDVFDPEWLNKDIRRVLVGNNGQDGKV